MAAGGRRGGGLVAVFHLLSADKPMTALIAALACDIAGFIQVARRFRSNSKQAWRTLVHLMENAPREATCDLELCSKVQ